MSGGLYDYHDTYLKSEIFGWEKEKGNVFEDIEITELIYDVFELIHSFDWYKSGDTDREDYLEAKALFKAKWFTDPNERVQEIVDKAIRNLKDELYETFGIEGEDK